MSRINQIQSHLTGNATAASVHVTTAEKKDNDQNKSVKYPNLPASIPASLADNLPGPWELANSRNGHGFILKEYAAAGRFHILIREWRAKYGPIFGFCAYEPILKKFAFRVAICDPEEAKRLLKINPPKFGLGQGSVVLGNGVLSVSDMQEWARQRELLKPAFTNAALKELMPVMSSGVKKMLEDFAVHCQRNEEFDIHEEISEFAFLAIGHSALGEEDEFLIRRAKPLRDAFNTATFKEVQRSKLSVDVEYREAKEEIDSFTQETIDRYQQAHLKKARNPNDIAEAAAAAGCPVAHTLKPSASAHAKKDTLLSLIMGSDAQGCPVMDNHLRKSSLSTFMFAGHETTSHTLSWAIMELGKNPQYQKLLQQEIDRILSQVGGFDRLEYKDLFKFEYLTLCINETLRLWPVVAQGTSRVLDKDTEVKGIMIPNGSFLFFPHMEMHRDKQVWGEDADKFVPHRKWFPNSFLPFTIAPRDCLGRNLAMMEMRMTLIGIYSKFNVHLADPDFQYEGRQTFTLFPENGVSVYLEKRF